MVQAWGLSPFTKYTRLRHTAVCAFHCMKGENKRDCEVDAVPLGKKKSRAEGRRGNSKGNRGDNQVCDTRVGMYWKEAYCLVQFTHILHVPIKTYFQRIV